MCLGVPGRIVEIQARGAVVDFWGVRRHVSLDIVDEPVALGDYVLVHVGFAIRRIPEDELDNKLSFFEQLTADDLEGLPPPGPAGQEGKGT
jgi:hydrogenase expression/formation protein HypC